jgi:phosphoribosylaminoimidazole (AIR) synthetase
MLVDWGGVADSEAFATWNMGIGLVAVTAATDERAALRALPDAIRIGGVERARPAAPRVRWASR